MIQVIRAETLAQRAGAYYVRIQAMARKYHITLEQEFDDNESEAAREGTAAHALLNDPLKMVHHSTNKRRVFEQMPTVICLKKQKICSN